jgi:hypothetical protein
MYRIYRLMLPIWACMCDEPDAAESPAPATAIMLRDDARTVRKASISSDGMGMMMLKRGKDTSCLEPDRWLFRRLWALLDVTNYGMLKFYYVG